MTFEKLEEIIKENSISHDVVLLSDSKWECGATCMDGIYFNKVANTMVFTQSGDEYEDYYTNKSWELLWSNRFEINNNIIRKR